MRFIPGVDDESGWRRLLFALTGLTAIVYLYHALFEPGTLTFTWATIQDDSRQFLSWMGRFDDAGAMPGDLLADYWQAMSPGLYRFVFGAADALGIEPLLFARLLPVGLLFFSAWMSWRVALLMSGRPVVAWVVAAFVTGFILHEDSIYSATPRSFSAPLFLLFLDGLLRDRGWVTIPTLFLLGLLYPTTAFVGLTMLGLSRIGWRPFRIDFSLRTWLLCGLGALAVGAAVVPFAGSTSDWGPTLTLSQALDMPNMGTPEGRSAIVGLNGSIDYLCSNRMGLLTEIVPCWSTPLAVIPNFLLMVPLFVLALLAARRSRYQPGEQPGDLVHVWALAAGIAWWAVAIQVAFMLHLPSRYTQRPLSILEFLAIGQVVGLWIDARLRARPDAGLTRWATAGLGIFLFISFVTPTPGLGRPADPDAIERIAAMPTDTVVGGVSDTLDYVPALAGRPTLASIEHSIPFHVGYFARVQERLEAGLMAVSSPDPAPLADYVRRYQVKVIAVDRALLNEGVVPRKWATVVPGAAGAAQERLDAGRSALQQRAEGCRVHDGPLVLLDAECLIGS